MNESPLNLKLIQTQTPSLPVPRPHPFLVTELTAGGLPRGSERHTSLYFYLTLPLTRQAI